jgi:hypothetical protein
MSSVLTLRLLGRCDGYQCTRITPQPSGGACSGNFEYAQGISCVNGACTGGENFCVADDGNPYQQGLSDDCTSNFCRGGVCSNVPVAGLGDICDDDRDCAGANGAGVLLYCGQPSANVRRCGGGGAFCTADGSGTGGDSSLCVSGKADSNAKGT